MPTAADYQTRLIAELPSLDILNGGVISSSLSADDQAWMLAVWPQYQQWANLDPDAPVVGPHLQYLHVKLATVDYLLGKCWQEVDGGTDGYQEARSKYSGQLQDIRKNVLEAINEVKRRIVGLRGGAVGLPAAVTPESSPRGWPDRNREVYAGDPRYPLFSRGW